MKIIGIGVDIVDSKRIAKSIKNKLFLKRIYTKQEIMLSKKTKNKISFFANRFAAKEAFAKSLGKGFRNGLNFKDISIKNNKFGKPEILVNNKIKSILKKNFKNSKFKIFLSLSDEKNHSIAFVIVNKI